MSSFSGSSSHHLPQASSPSPDGHHFQLPSIGSFLGIRDQPPLFSSSYFTQTPIHSPLTWSFTPYQQGDTTSYPMDALTLTYRSLAHGVHAAAQCVPKPVKIEFEFISHPQFNLAPSPVKSCPCTHKTEKGEAGIAKEGSSPALSLNPSPSPASSKGRSSSKTPRMKKPRTEAQREKAREYARAWRAKRYAKVVGIADAPVERMEKMKETALKLFKVKLEPVDSGNFNGDEAQQWSSAADDCGRRKTCPSL